MVPFLSVAVAGIFAGKHLRAFAAVAVVSHAAVAEPLFRFVVVFVYEVDTNFSHGLPSVFKHLALGRRSACTYNLYVGIFLAYSLDERRQTLEVRLFPLLVAHGYIFKVEGCGMPHFGALASPCSGGVAVGKLNEVEAVLYVWLQLAHRHVGAVVLVLKLACHAHVKHRQRLGTNVFRQLEIFEETQSVALIVVGTDAALHGILPAVFVHGAVLHGAYRVLPLIACLQVGTLNDASARKAEHARVHVGQCLSQVGPHAVLAVFECFYGEEAYVLETHRSLAVEQDAQACFCVVLGRPHYQFIFFPFSRCYLQFLCYEGLRFAVGQLVYKFHLYAAFAPGCLCPQRQSVVFALL